MACSTPRYGEACGKIGSREAIKDNTMLTRRGIGTPIPRLARPKAIFLRTQRFDRPLRLVVDHRAVAGSQAGEELHRLRHHPLVELWSTSPFGRRFFYPRRSEQRRDGLTYDYIQGDKWGRGWVANLGNLLSSRDGLATTGFPATHDWLERAICLLAAADGFEADAVISDGTFLLLREWPHGLMPGLAILSPQEALALIGLRLRIADEVSVYFESGASMGIGLVDYYELIARDAIPAMHAWFALRGPGDRDRVDRLTTAALVRLRHALRARDLIQCQTQLRTEPSLAAIIYHLDMLLLSLSGVFDSVAHVANTACGLQGPARDVGWLRKDWREKVRSNLPAFAELTVPGSSGEGVLVCLSALRNLVHSEVFASHEFWGAGRRRHRLEVPDRPQWTSSGVRPVRDVVWDAAECAGDASGWGLERPDDGSVFLEPGLFIEQLLVVAMALLDELMNATVQSCMQERAVPDALPLTHHAWHFPEEIHRSLGYLGGLAWVDE